MQEALSKEAQSPETSEKKLIKIQKHVICMRLSAKKAQSPKESKEFTKKSDNSGKIP